MDLKKKKALKNLVKKQNQKKNNKHNNFESEDSEDFVENNGAEYSEEFEDELGMEEKQKQKNKMKLMQSSMITKGGNKKKEIVDTKKADDIIEDLFAENQENDMEEEQDENLFGENNLATINPEEEIQISSKKRNRNQFEEEQKKAQPSYMLDDSEPSMNMEEFNKIIQNQKNQKQQQQQQEFFSKIDESSNNSEMIDIQNIIKKQEEQKQKQLLEQQQKQKQFLQQKQTIQQKVMSDRKQNTDIEFIQNSKEDTSINFFLIDMYEDDRNRKGKLFLTGKVFNKKTSTYESMTLIIQNNLRYIYFYPKENSSKHEVMDEVKQTLKKYLKLSDDHYSIQMEKKKYAFELDIPRDQKIKFVEVNYAFDNGTLPSDLTGQHFSYVIGTTYTALELFLLEMKIKGPQWIKINNYGLPNRASESNAKFEFNINAYTEDLELLKEQPEAPLLKCVSIAVKTFRNPEKKDELEILEISLLTHSQINTDKLTDMVGIDKKSFIRPYKIGSQLPYDFEKNKQQHVSQVNNEFNLLQSFVDYIQQYDPDILVGHDMYGELMDIILNRLEKCGVKSSKMARLSGLPQNSYKGAPTAQRTRGITKGRLVVDTYAMAKELVRDNDYNLTQMAKRHLNKHRQEFQLTSLEQVQQIYDKTENINTLIKYNDIDALLQLELMFKLQIIPLTKQLTNIAGNVWNRSLQNQRAERNEMLLMHEFWNKGYIVPDKYKIIKSQEEGDQTGKKDKKYAGGMVIEPKAGFYEDYVLLLDFNSLYPSIIQEFNLCFTTVQRPSLSLEYYHRQPEKKQAKKKNNNNKNKNKMELEDKNKDEKEEEEEEEFEFPEIPEKTKQFGILPKTIRYLVERRKQVKGELKSATNEEIRNSLDIKQLAFKLVANSMYGCLGFGSSRFYAKPIAALITKQGRDILENAMKIVDQLNYEVIYGDTDSLMIYPKTDNLNQLFTVGYEIKKNVSKQYTNLVFDIDGVYKNMLLLKKKKYACMKMDNFAKIMVNPNEKQIWKKEVKGLDVIRRDWSVISRTVGQQVLDLILADKTEGEEIVPQIYNFLETLNKDLNEGKKYKLNDFLITKVLTKDPSQYPDGKGLPHVVVAKRLIQQGKATAKALVNHVIYYAVCEVNDANGNPVKGLAEKCFSQEEIVQNKYTFDLEYYKSNQILAVIDRMVHVLPNLSRPKLAECLGLDPKKYQNRTLVQYDTVGYDDDLQDEKNPAFQILIEENLLVKCLSCQNIQPFKGLMDINSCKCAKCGLELQKNLISNKIRKFVRDYIQKYYKNTIQCTGGNCVNPMEITQFYIKRKPCQSCGQGRLDRPCDELYIQIILKGIRGMLDTKKKCYESLNIKKEYLDLFEQECNYVNYILEQSNFEKIEIGSIFSKLKM